LDFQRLWQRLFRIAGIEIEQTQGFNPRPRLRFALPLPTGFESEGELLEAFLVTEPADNFLQTINAVCPPGLAVLAATPVALDFPKLTALVDALEYRINLPGGEDVVLEEKGDMVKTKSGCSSISEFVLFSQARGKDWHLLLKVDNQQTLRPDYLAHHFFPQYDEVQFKVTRTGIFTRKKVEPLPKGLSFLID
jgi:radical SAM-linked protein